MAWTACLNPLIYRSAYRLRNLPILIRSRRWIRDGLPAAAVSGAARPAGVLLLAWGRLGDTLLELPLIRGLRRLFPEEPLVCLGRKEIGPLLQGEVDRFLPFSPAAWMASPEHRGALLAEVGRPWVGLFGDVHLFHGGLFYLGELFERLPARHKAHYQGHGLDRGFAPWRLRPAAATLVPARPLPPGHLQEPCLRHLWHDGLHYLEALRRLFGPSAPSDPASSALPALLAHPPGALAPLLDRFGLAAGRYIACQPASSNRRKDYPAALWRRVWAAFPEQRFVLLGTEAEAGGDHGRPDVVDLRGRTSLVEAVHLLRACRAFLGLDSGLTHLAAHLGRPTLCLAQASSLGYFFPYPEAMGALALRVLAHPGCQECAGCLAVCRREPLWRTYRRGARCLRELGAEPVIAALAELLAAPPSLPEQGLELGV